MPITSKEKSQEILSVTPSYRVVSESGPDHDKKFGKTADPSSFFTNSDAYNFILDNYSKRRQLLQKQVGPTAQ